MKTIYSLLLSLAVAMAIPAAAQQNSVDQPQASPSSQQAQSTDQQAATGKEPLKYEKNEGFWGHLNPFARKKYVNRQLDPIRGRVNELDELTAKNSKMIADVDARSTEGIRQAMSKANDADSHAIDAGSRASQAQQAAQEATSKIGNAEQAMSKMDQYQAVTETEIRFRPGQADLSKKAKDALSEMADSLKNQRGYVIEVQGFSPGRGSAAIENSRLMAQSVVRYLVLNHEVPVYRIYTVGMGNAPFQAAGKTVSTRGGRVEISLLKNSLGDLVPGAANNASSPAANTQGLSRAAAAANQTAQPDVAPASQEKPSPANPSKPPLR
jgi:outer membrane protein OmpA-like peptidoglycan-associated protein